MDEETGKVDLHARLEFSSLKVVTFVITCLTYRNDTWMESIMLR
jgi:hypothetical protein